ncbi:MAG: SEC-C domain-containing protein [Gemmatimonadota bacterium]
MLPSRNDPCPCGSGRKYKRCCSAKDRASAAVRLVSEEGDAEAPLDPAVAPRPGAAWEADLVPLPISFGDDADARPAGLLVVADGFVLHHDLHERPPADPGDVADLLAQAIRAAAERVGAPPSRVLVRHAAVASALRDAALPGQPQVTASRLPDLDAAASHLISHLTGAPVDRPVAASSPETWTAWGLGRPVVADLFRAAAAFHRAKPWRELQNEAVLQFASPSGGEWTVCVMGAGGEQFGVVLYEDPDDFRRLIEVREPRRGLHAMRSAVLSLTFDRRADLPPRMRKEILAASWEVAGPDAYPSLIAINTPGGGITSAQGADLIAALRSVPAFVTQFRAELRSWMGERLEWRDPETGVTLTLPRNDDWQDFPPRPDVLTPALPTGPGAAPEKAILRHEPEKLWQREQPLFVAFVDSLLERDLSERTVERHAANVGLLLDYLASYESIPLNAMTEYDLRIFVHDWCLRRVEFSAADLRGIPVSLKRFFAFVAERERVVFPWAAEILADRARYEERLASRPGHMTDDAAVFVWEAEVSLALSDRELLPDNDMADGGTWGETMGSVERTLHRELGRRWLLWRDEVIAAGMVAPTDVRKALIERQREWESRPHKGCGGATPVAAVAREREGGSSR